MAAPQLALEALAITEVFLDGAKVETTRRGYYIDEAIETIDLPPIRKGTHELRLTIPMRRKVSVEAVYLLGDFGVRVAGRHAVITPPVRSLTWGDWVHQGLLFYGGNVTYHVPHAFASRAERLVLRAETFKAPLLTVDVAGKRVGPIAVAPFEVQLPALAGPQTIDITALGYRANTLGPVHCANERLVCIVPYF